MMASSLLTHRMASRMLQASRQAFTYGHNPAGPVQARCMRRTVNLTTQAQQQDTASNNGTPPQPTRPAQRTMPARPPPGRPSVMLGPDGQPLEVVAVEKTGPDAWAGVAAIDDGKSFDWNRALLMAGGDSAALLLFACIGRINHGGVLDVETIYTAAPFIAGWLVSAPFLGGYGPAAQGSKVGPAALTAAKCWAVATPLGLVFRGLSKGYVPPTSFIVVSLVATAVLMVGWRSALAATTKEAAPMTAAQSIAARKDKQGNPFEFVQLLMSLTKRW